MTKLAVCDSFLAAGNFVSPFSATSFQPNTMSSNRKSVAFSEGTTVVDGNGEVKEMNGTTEKTSAESHTACELITIRECPFQYLRV